MLSLALTAVGKGMATPVNSALAGDEVAVCTKEVCIVFSFPLAMVIFSLCS